MDYAAILAEDRRIAILRLLEGSDGTISDSVAQDALAQLGNTAAREVIRADFAWLAENGLVTVEMVTPTLAVAAITQLGIDTATGRHRVKGVKRPGPTR